MGIIVAGFSGIGKSVLTKSDQQYTEVNTSQHSWVNQGGQRVRAPGFLEQHLADLQTHAANSRAVFTSTHADVRQALCEAKQVFALVYPGEECRSDYLRRYADRNSPRGFQEKMATNFEDYIQECRAFRSPYCVHVELLPKRYLVHALPQIEAGVARRSVILAARNL